MLTDGVSWLGLVELVLVFAIVMGWGLNELRQLRRHRDDEGHDDRGRGDRSGGDHGRENREHADREHEDRERAGDDDRDKGADPR